MKNRKDIIASNKVISFKIFIDKKTPKLRLVPSDLLTLSNILLTLSEFSK